MRPARGPTARSSTDLPDFEETAWIIGGAQLHEATLDEVDIFERTFIDVSVAHLVPHNAVYAPRLTGDFDLVSESNWFTCERDRVIADAPTGLRCATASNVLNERLD